MTIALCILAYLLIGFIIGCCIVYYHEEWGMNGVEMIVLTSLLWLPAMPFVVYMFLAEKAVDILHKLHERGNK